MRPVPLLPLVLLSFTVRSGHGLLMQAATSSTLHSIVQSLANEEKQLRHALFEAPRKVST